jgi:hypothetical protein
MYAAALPQPQSTPVLKRMFHALLGSTLFGLTAAAPVRAELPKEMHVTEDIALSGHIAGVDLPLDKTAAQASKPAFAYAPVATPDGLFMDDAMDAADYRHMLEDIQMQQFILVGGVEFSPAE